MDDFLDDLLRDSDDEDLPTAVKVHQPKLINTKIRLCSPNKNAVQSSCLGVVKHVKEDLKNVMSDPFFGIRFKSGVVDLSALEMLCKDIERVPLLSKVRPSQSTWLSVGVIVEKSVTLKSSNGNEYMIWKVHDLKNCDDKPLKMLLFGEAVKEHWKLQKGSVILIMSPQVMLDDKTSESIFKLSKSSSIIYIGSSVDLGKCKGKKQDGSECRAFVNEAKCEMCVYHAASEVRKLAARRGTFSQSILIPKKNGVVIKNNANLLSQSKPKIFASHSYISKNKEEMIKKEKETLNSIVHAKTTLSLGARCLASITTGSDVLQNISGDDAISFKQFLNSKHVDTERRVNGRTVKEEDAVKRALRVLEENKMKEGGKRIDAKRGRVEYREEEGKEKRCITSGRNRVLELLAKRSRHSNEADEMENDLHMDHLNSLEKREALETVATSCMQLNEVKVFSCVVCKYTSRKRSQLCIKQGHTTNSHYATKRFFSCKECSYKSSSYSLLPTHRCQRCKCENWERVSMIQEKKVVLDTEKLEVRGEERRFIN